MTDDQPARLGEVIRDAERLLAQALNVVRRDVDPLSMDSQARARFWLDSARSHIQAALSDLAEITNEVLPPVGSAVPVPVARPTNPGPPPASAAPVSLPGRGVGPGVLGPSPELQIHLNSTVTTEGQAAFAKAVTDALRREGQRRKH